MLVKKFLLFLTLLMGIFFSLILHSEYSQTRQTQIESFTTLTKLPGLALSTGYLEKRVIYYEDHSNSLYPKMRNYLKMDYVYAK